MKTRLTHGSYMLFTGFFLFVIVFALGKKDGHYIFDSIKFIVLISLFYFFFEKLNLSDFIFISLGIAMVLHELGRFGLFNVDVWILPWDVITHFFSSFVIVLALFRVLEKTDMPSGWKAVLVFCSALGLATLGEFLEFFGAVRTPDGRGILGVEARISPISWLSADYWDTMKDLVFNAVGGLFGLGVWHIWRRRKSNPMI